MQHLEDIFGTTAGLGKDGVNAGDDSLFRAGGRRRHLQEHRRAIFRYHHEIGECAAEVDLDADTRHPLTAPIAQC
ncbi:hypothetical protein ABMA59_15790 [Mesorhizobium sp. CN2-181]